MHRSFWSFPLSAGLALSSCLPKGCPEVKGDLTIDSFQLYPENTDFDAKRCVAYFSVLYNATVAVYDPNKNVVVKTLTVPGLSGNPLLHSSGVQVDPRDRLSIVIDAGSSFDTGGQNISGVNFLVKYGLKDDRVLWKANLTAVTNGVYSGYQDIEHDELGNTFVLGTFPSSIIRVSADGKQATPWYLATPPDHTVHGYSGIVNIGKSLIVSDNTDGQLYKFDIRAQRGTPVRIPLSSGDGPIGLNLDGAYLPPRYSDKVLLISDNVNGTYVLRSSDGKWNTAENLGVVPNSLLSEGGTTVASLQIGESIYTVTEFFGDARVPGTLAGNRTSFPLIDITSQVESLLK
ncbi:Trichothecene biosynthesis protein 14 like [Verticillium longisporum]|nr:Trichothecene biosynthesis protein 14 like [Verticillium longisporum]KAG7123043.1 Trichothecene biosynthesis protein 14 like [Verticillium longisporum]